MKFLSIPFCGIDSILHMSKTLKIILIIVAILIVDQVSKFIVKTNMTLYEQIPVFGNWFIIHFVENRGMAFGMNLPGDYGKILLSLFRLAAIIAIGFYIRHLVKENAHRGLLITLSMVMAGAIGNMIDSAFYGMIFNESNRYLPAVLFPEGGGYDTFLHGNVVDMFYFPIINGSYPEWFPWIGGQTFTFFRPVFNVADASISVAVIILLIKQKSFFKHLDEKDDEVLSAAEQNKNSDGN
ncbi:MAG TPA: lipoprotein signal peptidase [Bacteroidales bacterium]|nr:lipoprotein signal peptidase [Bacteroidales bacterium]